MILKGLEEGSNVDSVYLDFSKAFDKVDKGILARKMKPQQSIELQRIEKLFKTYSKRIPEIHNETYWKRLSLLKMNSQQRRMERYRILYTWKAIENVVPYCGITIRSSKDSNLDVHVKFQKYQKK